MCYIPNRKDVAFCRNLLGGQGGEGGERDLLRKIKVGHQGQFYPEIGERVLFVSICLPAHACACV